MAVLDKEYTTKEYARKLIFDNFNVIQLPAGDYTTYNEIETELASQGYDIANLVFTMKEARIGNAHKRTTDFATVRKGEANAEREYTYKMVANGADISFREVESNFNAYTNVAFGNRRWDHIGANTELNQKVILRSNREGSVLISFQSLPNNRVWWGGGVYQYDTQDETTLFYLTQIDNRLIFVDGSISTTFTQFISNTNKDMTGKQFIIKSVDEDVYLAHDLINQRIVKEDGNGNNRVIFEAVSSGTHSVPPSGDNILFIDPANIGVGEGRYIMSRDGNGRGTWFNNGANSTNRTVVLYGQANGNVKIKTRTTDRWLFWMGNNNEFDYQAQTEQDGDEFIIEEV